MRFSPWMCSVSHLFLLLIFHGKLGIFTWGPSKPCSVLCVQRERERMMRLLCLLLRRQLWGGLFRSKKFLKGATAAPGLTPPGGVGMQKLERRWEWMNSCAQGKAELRQQPKEACTGAFPGCAYPLGKHRTPDSTPVNPAPLTSKELALGKEEKRAFPSLLIKEQENVKHGGKSHISQGLRPKVALPLHLQGEEHVLDCSVLAQCSTFELEPLQLLNKYLFGGRGNCIPYSKHSFSSLKF